MTGFIILCYTAVLVASLVTTYKQIEGRKHWEQLYRNSDKGHDALKQQVIEMDRVISATSESLSHIANSGLLHCQDCGMTLDETNGVVGKGPDGYYVACVECAEEHHRPPFTEGKWQFIDSDLWSVPGDE